jgi:hypothetical protein
MNSPDHDLYKDGDPDLPKAILDANGQVVLNLCKVCSRGEIELSEPCSNQSSYDGKQTND